MTRDNQGVRGLPIPAVGVCYGCAGEIQLEFIKLTGPEESKRQPEFSSLEDRSASASTRCPFAFQWPSFGNSNRSAASWYRVKNSGSRSIASYPLADALSRK